MSIMYFMTGPHVKGVSQDKNDYKGVPNAVHKLNVRRTALPC